MCTSDRARGFTLAELLLLIVILAIGLIGIIVLFNTVVVGSVDPMARKQAMAVAESMLEEIQLQPFNNPSGGWSGAASQANRGNFDDIGDYNGFATTGIYTIDNTAIPDLAAYNLAVVVDAVSVGGIPGADSRRIQVTVTGPRALTYVLEGYKLNY